MQAKWNKSWENAPLSKSNTRFVYLFVFNKREREVKKRRRKGTGPDFGSARTLIVGRVCFGFGLVLFFCFCFFCFGFVCFFFWCSGFFFFGFFLIFSVWLCRFSGQAHGEAGPACRGCRARICTPAWLMLTSASSKSSSSSRRRGSRQTCCWTAMQRPQTRTSPARPRLRAWAARMTFISAAYY
jgi:hypothetical protein